MSETPVRPARHQVSTGDQVADLVWNDLRGEVPIARVREVTAAIAARFEDAPIRVFIPIFVRRHARDLLQASLDSGTGAEH